jgi:uncharacterized protein YjbI with pentapeptide repeats
MKMNYGIKNRTTGEVQLTAEIDCDTAAPESVKKGLAIQWAIKNHADLSNAELRNADLRNANLSGSYLNGLNLRMAILSNANLSGASLRYSDLSHANLSDAILVNADLSGVDLRDAILMDAKLKGANLEYANLSGAHIRGAELSWANLIGAILPTPQPQQVTPAAPKEDIRNTLQSAVDLISSFILDNTEDDQGFESIPDLDDARTILQDLMEELPPTGEQA